MHPGTATSMRDDPDLRDDRDPLMTGGRRLHDPLASQSERSYAMFAHLSLIAMHFTGLLVVLALVLWLIRRRESPFIDDHGREAVNFQISLLIYGVALLPLGLLTCGAGWALYIPLYVFAIVAMILAAVAANSGQYYRYPVTLRLVR